MINLCCSIPNSVGAHPSHCCLKDKINTRRCLHWLFIGTQFPQKEAATDLWSEMRTVKQYLFQYIKKPPKPPFKNVIFFLGSAEQFFSLRLYQKLMFCVNTVGLHTKDHAQKCCGYLGFWWTGVIFTWNQEHVKKLFSHLSRRTATETKVKTFSMEPKAWRGHWKCDLWVSVLPAPVDFTLSLKRVGSFPKATTSAFKQHDKDLSFDLKIKNDHHTTQKENLGSKMKIWCLKASKWKNKFEILF